MKPVSILTLRRLSQYLERVLEAKKEGKANISATTLANLTGVHRTQVRKDLAVTGVVGVPKVGHKVDDLVVSIGDFLNWNDTTEAFLVGAGNLGSALLGFHMSFADKGLNILAAFDNDPAKAGTEVHGIPVYPLDKFSDLAKRLHIHIGILAVPPLVAQQVTNMMLEAGVLAVWNFTPAPLTVPEGIIVENVDLMASLAVLSHRLSERLQPDRNRRNDDRSTSSEP